MSDDNDPVINCLLEVCCLGDSEQQQETMAAHLVKECGCDPAVARVVGDHILKTFDLAEKGTLKAFKKSIVRVYKSGPQPT